MTMITIIPTIDTENFQTPLLQNRYQENMLYPVFDNEDWGAVKIANILDEFDVKGTFFLTVSEMARWGEKPLRQLARLLTDAGHDVGLHSHPVWQDEKQRVSLWEYSITEQQKIINNTKEILEKWISQAVVAHRAGAYGLDQNTLKSLKLCQIPVDSSMFYGHPNCKVNWSKNKIIEKDGIIEVPVTGFSRMSYWKAGPLHIRLKTQFVKTDLDSCSLEELKWFVHEAQKHDIKIINLFMHSYSLIKNKNNFRYFEPNSDQCNKLREFIRYSCNLNNVRFLTLREFLDSYQINSNEFNGSDYVPVMKINISILEKLYKKLFG